MGGINTCSEALHPQDGRSKSSSSADRKLVQHCSIHAGLEEGV